MSEARGDGPFVLPDGVVGIIPGRRVGAFVAGLIEKAFGLAHLQSLYQSLPPARDDREFIERVFEVFNIGYRVDGEALAGIPRSGALVVVANHPFGAIEGVLLAALLRSIRGDVKIMANFVLNRIPELRDLFIGVDPYAGAHAAANNVPPMRQAVRWLKGGGLLVVFPAGEVSYWSPRTGRIADPPWSRSIARLIRRTGADALPVYFAGANSLLFQVAGLMHPRVRTVLLPREFMNKSNATIDIRIGRAISHGKMRSLDDQALIDHLRLRTYLLGGRETRPGSSVRPVADGGLEPIVDAVDRRVLAEEVSGLCPSRCLVANGDMRVYYTEGLEAPGVLREIGRLRESTFRAAGEGSGRAIDLDRYDEYYLHLFIWNVATEEIVGAYRLGQGDVIARRFGKQGFYSHSLFEFRTRFLDKINPALEMGRSFVRPEYQRSFSPLMLLWKGIARYVHRHPRYRRLFGPVSISGEYRRLSRELMVDFLQDHAGRPDMSRDVRPRRPFHIAGRRDASVLGRGVDDIDLVSDLVASIEPDAKGVPVLLRQYLRLGGRILGFSLDPDFSDVLDGLIMVDLMETDPSVLSRYMGRAEMEAFRALHGEGDHGAAVGDV